MNARAVKELALAVATLAGALVCAGNLNAQAWPAGKPIRIITASQPGGVTDTIARVVSDKMKDPLGATVVIDNRPAAGGIVANGSAAKAAPDGYTLLVSFSGSLTILPNINKSLGYDTINDLSPITMLTANPNVLIVSASIPVNSVQELIAHARKSPGALSYASVGAGSSAHLSMELLKSAAGLDIAHIPYNGTPNAVTSLVSGDTQVFLSQPPPGIQQLVQAKKVKLLAVSSLDRFQLMPDIPTMNESGVPGFETIGWTGMFAPAGTSREIINRLNKEANIALQSPDVRAALNKIGFGIVGSTPEEMRNRIERETQKWAPVVKRIGLSSN